MVSKAIDGKIGVLYEMNYEAEFRIMGWLFVFMHQFKKSACVE